MGIVFIMGAQESSKDAIMEVLLEDKTVPRFRYINIEDLEMHKKELKKFIQEFNKDVQKDITEGLRTQTNIVVNTPVTIETEKGYVPLFSDDFFEIINPDVIILVEEIPYITLSKQEKKKISMQQELNREYVTRYSSDAGTPLKIIKARPGKIKESIKEVKVVIKSVMATQS